MERRRGEGWRGMGRRRGEGWREVREGRGMEREGGRADTSIEFVFACLFADVFIIT